MDAFGYGDSLQVRQPSLDAVLVELYEWGIDCAFPSGFASAHDDITLLKIDRANGTPDSQKAATQQASEVVPTEAQCPGLDPLSFAFKFDDGRFGETCQDLFASVWSAHPVCLVVKANDEFFTLAAGVLGALMRRRGCMFESGSAGDLPVAPAMVSVDALRRFCGRIEGNVEPFPLPGAVYMVRGQDEDMQIDELTAFVREALVPHTYRLAARHLSTEEAKAADPARFREVLRWLSGYAGVSSLMWKPGSGRRGGRQGGFELASLLAEASQLKDVLLERSASQALAARGFNGGNGFAHAAA